jgi:hypothetical protein
MEKNDTPATTPGKNKRRRKFILRDLQLSIALHTLFVAVPILLLNFLLTHSDTVKYLQETSTSADTAVIELSSTMFKDFLIALAISVPFAVGVGILYSFTFCGPLFRFNKYLTGLLTGRWDRPCTLREGDKLQDLRDSINNAVGLMAKRVHSQYELLRDVRAALGEPAPGDGPFQELIQRIDQEQAEVAPRFDDADPERAPQSEPGQRTVTAAT